MSSVLLRFLFGSSIYSRYDYRGLMAPSYYFLSIGYVTLFDRVLSYLVDATVFGAIIYSSIRALLKASVRLLRFL